MMSTVVNSSKMTAELSLDDVDCNTNKTSIDFYQVENKKTKTKSQTSRTPHYQIKFKSAKKSSSIPSINMSQSTIKFPRNSKNTDSNTEHEKINIKAKEAKHNLNNTKYDNYLTSLLNEDSLLYGRVGKPNVIPDPDLPFGNNFRQNQEYWQDIAAKSIIKRRHQKYPLTNHSVGSFESKQYNYQKHPTVTPHEQTHSTDINNTSNNKYMQIESFKNVDEHEFPSYSSGLSNNNVCGTFTSRIQQLSEATSPLIGDKNKMKFIPTRSDETSCGSSFEQLNIIGIPTTSSTAISFPKQITAKAQYTHKATMNSTEKQINSNYDIQFDVNSVDRIRHSSETKKRRPLPTLPIEKLVSLDCMYGAFHRQIFFAQCFYI